MKLKPLLIWFAVNGAFALLLWVGFGPQRVDGARYLYTFTLWIFLFFTLIASTDEAIRAKARTRGRPVPEWLCVGFDVASAAFLVWNGSWFLGLLVIAMALTLTFIYSPVDKPEGEVTP